MAFFITKKAKVIARSMLLDARRGSHKARIKINSAKEHFRSIKDLRTKLLAVSLAVIIAVVVTVNEQNLAQNTKYSNATDVKIGLNSNHQLNNLGDIEVKTEKSNKKDNHYRPRQTQAAVSRGTYANRDDIYLMAKVIEGEAADEPMIGKVAVGAVILNRVDDPEFPKTIKNVIYQPLAFEAVGNGHYHRTLTAESVDAARLAINGWDPTYGATYYWNPYKKVNPWVWSRPIVTQIGNHVFAH